MSAPKYVASIGKQTYEAIYEGVTIAQLAAIFRKDARAVARKIHPVKPVHSKGGAALYDLSEAARYLVTPIGNLEETLMKMSPNDLPKELSRDFWAAMRAKQEFEERAGDLWPTALVIDAIGDIFKVVKMSSRLLVDGVERRTELSDKQRDIIVKDVEGMLAEMRKKIIQRFGSDSKYGESIEDASQGKTSDDIGDGDDDDDETL